MFLRGCCDDCNSLGAMGASGSVVSGKTCPDGTYLNVLQVQAGMQCPQVQTVSAPAPIPVASAPSAPAPSAPSAPPASYVAPTPVSTPVAPAPIPTVNRYVSQTPAIGERDIYIPQMMEQTAPGVQFETMKVSASGPGSDLKPIGSESSVSVTDVAPVVVEESSDKKPWWLLLLAGAVFLTN